MSRHFGRDPQVRYALAEANIAFLRKKDRNRADPAVVFLLLVPGIALIAYIVLQ